MHVESMPTPPRTSSVSARAGQFRKWSARITGSNAQGELYLTDCAAPPRLMCGIVGAVARENVTPVLLEGLRKLEYCGYDSAGIAVVNTQGLQRLRCNDKVAELIRESEFATDIESGFTDLTETYPEHIVRITKASELISLQDEGRLVDESTSSPPRAISKTGAFDRLPRMRLDVPYLVPSITRITPSELELPNVEIYEPIPMEQGLELVWKSKPLTERDLNIPSGTNTHPTGSINIDKGLLEDGIDHRHYFREEVFSALPWAPSSKTTVEETSAKFRFIVKGIDYGEFSLRIAHTTGTESPTYQQKNAMTRLSWGSAREHIARIDLIDRVFSLYRSAINPTCFVIEID